MTPPSSPSTEREISADEFERSAMAHLDRLYASALRLTRAPADAEDLVQDTMVKAFRFSNRFEPNTNMLAWLLRIQTNTFINKYRRNVRERSVFDGAAAKPVGEGMMSRDAMRGLSAPIEEAERSLLAEEIRQAIDELPDDYRVIVLLADVEELSYKEIAEALDCPIGTVMSRLHRARKMLQKKLIQLAMDMGIVAAPAADREPISLDAYRERQRKVAVQ